MSTLSNGTVQPVKGILHSTSTIETHSPTESDQVDSTAGGSGTARSSRPKSCSVQIREPPVSDTSSGGYTVVQTEEKHGPLQRAIPAMPLPLAVMACIFNIVIPGTGTLLSAFSVFCCGPTRISRPLHAFLLNVVSGLLQLATFLLIVGWIWSITWGMTFIQLAMPAKKDNVPAATVPYYVRRHSSVEH